MDGSIIHSGAALHFERHLDILDQLVIDSEIEVVYIAAPVSGGRDDSVGPTGVGIVLLLIVQEVGVEFPHDVVFVTEHEKTGRGGVLLSIGADAHGSQLQQEVLVLQCLPHMTGAGEAHPLTVAANALLVEYIHIHFVKDEHILSLHGGIPHHGLIFFLGAAVVALAVAAVGAEGITVHIDRLIRTFRAGNMDDHDVVAVHLLNEHIL